MRPKQVSVSSPLSRAKLDQLWVFVAGREIEGRLVSASDLQNAQDLCTAHCLGPVSAMVRAGIANESTVLAWLSQFMNWPVLDQKAFVSAAGSMLSNAQAMGLSSAWCQRNRLRIWSTTANADSGNQADFRAVLSDFPSAEVLAVLAQFPDIDVERAMLAHSPWFDGLGQQDALGVVGATEQQLRLLAEQGPVIELVNRVLSSGAQQRASDIHVEARERDFCIRYRVDGQMSAPTVHSRDLFDAFAVRLKILAALDIAERRLPQDGRIQLKLNGEDFDVRVSVLPATFGEGMVLRLLRSKRMLFSLHDLGLSKRAETQFERLLALPNGIILVTGPTGSGKSTSLYTALSKLNDGSCKIITVEDPVEYRIDGITQVQVNAAVGLDFARSLRSILRHDPDVLLIGEIRDKETAEIAVQAALTGHLVLSTLHTNSAVASIPRLIDMGIEPFLVSAGVRALMAQRLVRRLCEHCKVPTRPTAQLLALAQTHGIPLTADSMINEASAKGCAHCNHTGYHGRMAIYEIVEMNDALRRCVRESSFAEANLRAAAGNAQQTSSMLADGLEKVALGLTNFEEVLAAVD